MSQKLSHLSLPSLQLLLQVLVLVAAAAAPAHCLNQEGLYLLEALRGLDDPGDSLSQWNPHDPTPCNWTGVTCNADAAFPSVVSLDLSSLNLYGSFPTILCRLRNLSSLSLSNNFLNSTLPSSLSSCLSLRYLDLSQNLLVGPLPDSLPSLPNLLHLDLSGNNLTSAIPHSFATFPRLQVLSLVSNLFNDTVPSFLSNISTLTTLNLSYNPFSSSPLPPELGRLPNLRTLWLAGCNLVGPIPSSLGRLRRLLNLDLSANRLSGPIPSSLSALSSLVQLELYNNSLSGSIPPALLRLPLDSLNLYENRLSGPLPDAIALSPNLRELRLFSNRLSGPIPSALGRYSPLAFVDVSDNLFSGEIPPDLCRCGSLHELLLIDNALSGPIPTSLAQCRSLTRVRLKNNRLSGVVPPGFWGLPNVWLLELTGNSLSGDISPSISGAANLSLLLIGDNRFSGRIPLEIGLVKNLVEFSAGNNKISGSVPDTVENLAQLGRLDLHGNEISGEIPSGISSCKKLSDLNLAGNQLTGEIPSEIRFLPVLNYLDLSGNRLTGEIPLELQNLNLNRFNVSDNLLSGKLPPLYATETYRDSFVGNPGLCRDLEGLCPDSQLSESRNHRVFWLLRSIFILAALILVVGIAWFYVRYRNFKRSKRCADRSKWTLTSFHKLGFSKYEILDCLDEDNVIGSGASGKVYKVALSSGEVVAVKRLWSGGKKGEMDEEDERRRRISHDLFRAEVDTLGKIRHKSIVKLWCCCSTKDCKLLVYEYMPNGSLGDLLHSSKASLLDWPIRFKIAVEAAEGLSYLHHDCVPPIVHRDVKSNNILLDSEFGARVADFGIAKMVEEIGKGPDSMSVIAGSCGYIAPEYAYTLRVNEKSDIYSFGVVILELVTGKRPIDPAFGEKDLVKWVCTTLDQKGPDHVLDPKLDICFKEEMCKVLNIGLLCTGPLPINRPSMRRVVKMLVEITENKPKAAKKDGRLSPYYYEDGSDNSSVV